MVKKIDEYEQIVVLQDGTKIPLDDIIDIRGDLFRDIDSPH